MSVLEISANAAVALAIFLAGRNNVHTWWIGIIGCILFGVLFYKSQLYADVTLQAFFVVTGAIGWYQWTAHKDRAPLPITRTHGPTLAIATIIALIVGALYALLLRRYTDAYAPGWDSLMLVMSVIGQLLLMNRKLENWAFWLIVNTIAVPLFISRGLHLTAILYAAYWIHAIYAFFKWQGDFRAQDSVQT